MTTDYAEVARARLLILAVPSTVVREVLRALGDHLDGSHLVVHGVRGFASEGSASLDDPRPLHGPFETVSDIVRAETPVRRTGALGGPVQASEMIEGRPSAMICGSHYPEVIAAVTSAMAHPALRVYGTHDLRGLEWGAALVGCLSIGVGFAQQAGAGPGLLAALISRGVEEAARIAATDGAEERTLLGLGGYGDLLASIALSDRPEVMVGKALARGRTLDEAVAEAKLRVEAIGLIPRVARFARDGRVPAPTFDALEDILAGGKPPAIIERMFAACARRPPDLGWTSGAFESTSAAMVAASVHASPSIDTSRVLHDRDMLCFGHDWSGDPLSKTHLMRLLAKDNRVLWINSIGYRAPTASGRDFKRIVNKLKAFAEPVREVERNIFVLNPLAIPAYGVPWVRKVNREILRYQVYRAMNRLGFKRPVRTGSSTPPPRSSRAISPRISSSTTAWTSSPPSRASPRSSWSSSGSSSARRTW